MIHITEFVPDNLGTNQKIEKYINLVIQQIVKSTIEMHQETVWSVPNETSSVLEAVCPRTMLREKPKVCENRLYELYELISSPTIRLSIHPVYEYILFHCIEWAIDLGTTTTQEFCPIDNALREEIIQVLGNEAEHCIELLCDLNSYLEFCFWDWDFLPEYLSELTSLSMIDPRLFLYTMTYDELDQYVDLMDADLREEYLRFRSAAIETVEKEEDVANRLNRDITKALLSIQRNRLYLEKSEDEINDGVRDMLQFAWDVFDQTRQGESETRIQAGEVDFIFSKNGMPVAIAEALKMNSMNEALLYKHIIKAIDNYNPIGYPQVYLFIYVVAKDFDRFWKKCFSYLKAFDYHCPVLCEVTELSLPYTEFRQAMTVIERSGKAVTVQFNSIHLKK